MTRRDSIRRRNNYERRRSQNEFGSVAQYLQEIRSSSNNIPRCWRKYLSPPPGGRAISIAERQQLALRDKNRLLETKLRELIQFGEENDAISEKCTASACRCSVRAIWTVC